MTTVDPRAEAAAAIQGEADRLADHAINDTDPAVRRGAAAAYDTIQTINNATRDAS